MNKLVNEWIKVLRSHEYKQGDSVLHDPESDTYCCIGVAIDHVLGGQFDVGEIETDYGYHIVQQEVCRGVYFKNAHWENESAADIDFLWFMGIEGDRPVFDYSPARGRGCKFAMNEYLGHLNDHGHSFNDIANYLDVVFNNNWDCI